ncbi:transposon Tf2-6 polyprotein [Trichonephila clavipes]|nr:transposon Tf2-6 polyprotein [Trichonephila clavipes]
MSEGPILHLYKHGRKTELHTDACKQGYGAILLQEAEDGKLYPVKTVSAESALEKLKQQQKTFGNPIRIISDRGSAFTSKLFNDYCDEENIQHLQIATGVPRRNGQVERIHRTFDSSFYQTIIRRLNEMVQIRRQKKLTSRRNGERITGTTRIFKKQCKKNIETLQYENRKTYNRRRKKASLYKEGDLVAIQRTQFGAGLKN